jgi:uncharacterized protein YndB with AHSA1/START domain
MAPIVSSIEIARRPEDVFSYLMDPERLAEWQESLVSARAEGSGPPAVGSKLITVRRVSRGDRTMTMELTEITPPRSWSARGIDGPIRAIVKGTVEPIDEGAQSRVTIALDFEAHGIGKLLVPLIVRRQAKNELPRNAQTLKQLLEGEPA